jgi:hypothetical protein
LVLTCGEREGGKGGREGGRSGTVSNDSGGAGVKGRGKAGRAVRVHHQGGSEQGVTSQ